MTLFFRCCAALFAFAAIVAICFLGCFCYTQRQKFEELEVLTNAQHQKIVKIESKLANLDVGDLASATEDIRKTNSANQQELIERVKKNEEELEDLGEVKSSVRNLANGMFGVYPCSDIRYLTTALSYQSLPDDMRGLRRQLLDVQQQLLEAQTKTDGGLKDTVETLSMFVFGEYPHAEVAMRTSLIIDGTLKDQIQGLKRKVDALEFSMRFR